MYSKENVQAVYERLEEYLMTIETGEWAFGDCHICRTARMLDLKGESHRDCTQCVLEKLSPLTGGGPCISQTRYKMFPYQYQETSLYNDKEEEERSKSNAQNFENPGNTMENIKKRYREMRKHIEKEGY